MGWYASKVSMVLVLTVTDSLKWTPSASATVVAIGAPAATSMPVRFEAKPPSCTRRS